MVVEYICTELRQLLGIDIIDTDINDIYPLRKDINKPIKVELMSYLKKTYIIQNCYKLKGTNISIAQDLTDIQRNEAINIKEIFVQSTK